MNFFLYSVVLWFVSISCFSQAPEYEWAKGISGNGFEVIADIATDNQGNSYVGGYFGGSQLVIENSTYTSSGSIDSFVCKYDNFGNVLWSRKIGSVGFDLVKFVEVDSNYNVYFAGIFNQAITINGITVVNQGLNDVFFGKYDLNGNLLWLKSYGGANNEDVTSLATFTDDKICISGTYQSPTISLDTFILSSSTYQNFISTLNDDGSFLSAENKNFNIADVQFDNQGNYYLAANFNAPQIDLAGSIINNNGGYDFFMAKFDNSNNLIWFKNYGSPTNDFITDMSLNEFGDLVCLGYFGTSNLTIENINLTTNPSYNDTNRFFVKLNTANGQVDFARKVTTVSYDFSAVDIEVDSTGNIYIAGNFDGTAYVDGNAIDIFCSDCSNSKLLLQFNPQGQFQWYKTNGPVDSTGRPLVKVNDTDDLFYSDVFSNTTYTSFDSFTLTAQGDYDGFYTKISHSNLNTINFGDESSFLYPNPTIDFLYLFDGVVAKNSEYEIYDIIGRVVSRELSVSNDKIDVRFLPAGSYFLHIGERVYKFIKE